MGREVCVRWWPTFVLLGACTGESEDSEPAPVCEGDYSVFEPGMEVRTLQGNFYIELTEASPAPPDEGLNDWRVTVTGQSGTPANGGSVSVTPFMPAHGHGLNPARYGSTNEADGVWHIDPFDLIMPGVWEFEFLVTESMMNDTVTIAFCIEG